MLKYLRYCSEEVGYISLILKRCGRLIPINYNEKNIENWVLCVNNICPFASSRWLYVPKLSIAWWMGFRRVSLTRCRLGKLSACWRSIESKYYALQIGYNNIIIPVQGGVQISGARISAFSKIPSFILIVPPDKKAGLLFNLAFFVQY